MRAYARYYADRFGDRRYRDRYYGVGNTTVFYTPVYPGRNGWNDLRENFLRSVIANSVTARAYYPHRQIVIRPTYQPYYPEPYRSPVYSYHDPGYYAGDYTLSPVYVGNEFNGRTAQILGMIGSIAVPLLGDSQAGAAVSRVFEGLLATGYDEGYRAAAHARSQGYGGAYYDDPYDPYVYDNVSFSNIDYNPYSCLGENRLYLSEGYQLGYQDGLRDGSEHMAFNDQPGAVDLVSAFLGNIL